ncbi:hypothetical protein MVEN_00498400 [Mycena venus]|uniref:Uncharacterized protein n=1 Tax=Mycena venus TaxID=2733690 RepID=A0A8H6YVY3_9AGAR|nr:hypothetical protein MVEN_00498400 [Mycena venus]
MASSYFPIPYLSSSPSSASTPMRLLVPMPIPRTPNAPMCVFLRSRLRACEQKLLFYGSLDKDRRTSEQELIEFCRAQSAKSSYHDKLEIERYLRDFQFITTPLVKQGEITVQQRDFYFVSGIPTSLKDWFISRVPESQRTCSSPIPLTDSLGILYERFDPDSLLLEPWNKPEAPIPQPPKPILKTTTPCKGGKVIVKKIWPHPVIQVGAINTPPVPDKDVEESHVSYARAVSAEPHSRGPSRPTPTQPDIVIRLDLDPSDAARDAASRVHPARIFAAIHSAISPSKRLFAGVRWTRNWNLVVQVEPGTGTTAFMIDKYASQIWDSIRHVLGFPEGHPSPIFETGDSWHSVVFHNLPALPRRELYTLQRLQESLETGGFHGVVKACSIMCTDDELTRRGQNGIPVSMRVTVTTKEAAQELIDGGGMVLGGRYRATPYIPRSCSPRADSVPL